jgi:hypothetical protein
MSILTQTLTGWGLVHRIRAMILSHNPDSFHPETNHRTPRHAPR